MVKHWKRSTSAIITVENLIQSVQSWRDQNKFNDPVLLAFFNFERISEFFLVDIDACKKCPAKSRTIGVFKQGLGTQPLYEAPGDLRVKQYHYFWMTFGNFDASKRKNEVFSTKGLKLNSVKSRSRTGSKSGSIYC